MRVSAFSEIEQEFISRVHSIVWCSAATVDAQGRPRSRVLHPIWEGAIGWVMTGRHTVKTRDLAANPHVSLAYVNIADAFKPVYVDCIAEWEDHVEEKRRVRDIFATTPPPLGYDLGLRADDPRYGLLKLTPWRIELGDWFGEPKVWLLTPS